MALSFTHLWQQQEHSDVDVILKTVDSPDQDAPSDRNQLATFPAHSVLLSNSQVFQAQVRACCFLPAVWYMYLKP